MSRLSVRFPLVQLIPHVLDVHPLLPLAEVVVLLHTSGELGVPGSESTKGNEEFVLWDEEWRMRGRGAFGPER